MPNGWENMDANHAKAWKISKQKFQEKYNREPKSDNDFEQVMGIAKVILRIPPALGQGVD